MKFSKKKFLKNAPEWIVHKLKNSLDILDGMEVVFESEIDLDGYIPQYFIDGKEHYLYPVPPIWCD